MTRRRALLAAILAAALLLAVLVAPQASSSPDGLEKVAADEGFLERAEDHDLAGSPLAEYEVEGVDTATVSLAGVIGVVATFAVTTGALYAFGRRRRSAPTTAPGT